MWNSGARASVRSSPVKSRPMNWLTAFQVMLPWVSVAPLGRPVVPEVYMTRQGSSSATGSSRELGLGRGEQVLVGERVGAAVERRFGGDPGAGRRRAARRRGRRGPARGRRSSLRSAAARTRPPGSRAARSPAPRSRRAARRRRASPGPTGGCRRSTRRGPRRRRRGRPARSPSGGPGRRTRRATSSSPRTRSRPGRARSAAGARARSRARRYALVVLGCSPSARMAFSFMISGRTSSLISSASKSRTQRSGRSSG